MKALAFLIQWAMASVCVVLLVLLVVLTLAGCGGGDDRGPDQRTPGVDCKTHPEQCA